MEGRAKALGEVDLIAVAGADIGLDGLDALAIGGAVDVGGAGSGQPEALGLGRRLGVEQHDQPLPFFFIQRGMTDQLAGPRLVIADQRPGIETQAGIGQLQIGAGVVRHSLQAPPEVIAEITQQATGKGQVRAFRQIGVTQAGQGGARPREKGATRLAGSRLQHRQRPGRHEVVATPLGHRPPGIQQHRARLALQQGETRRGIGVVGQGMQMAEGHGEVSWEGRRASVANRLWRGEIQAVTAELSTKIDGKGVQA